MKRQHIEKANCSKDVSPTLVRELDALDAHRSAALNLDRQGVSVVTATREADRARLTRFLLWVNATYTLKSPATLSIFAHSKIGAAAQRYIKELVETHERKYSYASKMAASFVIAAKFVASRRTATSAPTRINETPVAQPLSVWRTPPLPADFRKDGPPRPPPADFQKGLPLLCAELLA